MNSKTKLIIGLVVVLAIAAVFLVRSDHQQAEMDALLSNSSQPLKEAEDGSLEPPQEISEVVSDQVAETGDVDQVVNAILSDYAQDLEAAQSGDEDLGAIENDILLINPDIYDENEF